MKIKPFAIALLLIFGGESAAECHSLRSLEWLPGTWVASSDKATVHETWRKVSPQTFEGKGWTTDKKGQLVSHETLRLVKMENQIFYLAKVAHNPYPVPFKATRCNEKGVTFENLNHDFPNSIEYQRTGEETLVNVEDLEGKGFSLKFKRQTEN